MNTQDAPYSLGSSEERKRRVEMLEQPHVAPLVDYLKRIKAEHSEKSLPSFDPCDGGINAKVLFLLEAPGPKAVGSAFISRNNPDPTARNMCELLQESGLERGDTLLWNIVPWYVGDGTRIRAVNRDDIKEAFSYLSDLLTLLPDLKVIVLVGKKAQSAKERIRELTDLPLFDTPHPSARVFNVWPDKRGEMRNILSQIKEIVAS